MFRIVVFAAMVFIAAFPPVMAQEAGVIASMDEMRFAPPKEKGSASLVDGRVGKAVRFEADAPSTFFTSDIHGKPEWDRAQGFSFWVRGNGSDGFGGLEFIYDDDYAVRYDVCFPVKNGEWRKISVAWQDLVPVLPGPAAKPLGTSRGNAASKLSAVFVGKWWYWALYPALCFDIDEIRLEPTIERDANDYLPDGPPLGRVLAKLKAGKPITIVTMGDSLTDKRHWANREVCWVDLLRQGLKDAYRSDVTIVNPAIGGTQLRQNVILIPRWLATVPEPDLVTFFFGGNDWDSGMRGAEFRRTCTDAVNRVRRATRGKADVLLITTNPSAARWGAIEELAEACRDAAKDRRAGLADTDRAFVAAGRDNPNPLFVHNRVHLSKAGHAIVAETVIKAIEQEQNPKEKATVTKRSAAP